MMGRNSGSTPTHFHSVDISNSPLFPSASCSEPMWDFQPWPSRLSERALWTSPRATWIIQWVFCCARQNALWTCLPALHPSTCHCGRALRAPCSSLASWCTCSTGSTHPGYPWDLCPRQHCTIPCGSCMAPLYNKVRKTWHMGRHNSSCNYVFSKADPAIMEWVKSKIFDLNWSKSVFLLKYLT